MTTLVHIRRFFGRVQRAVVRCVAFVGMLLLVAPSFLTAQFATVSGTVLADSSEKVLAQAEVSFPLLRRSTRTDSAGNFLLTGIKPGRQRFRIRLLGYEPLESWLVIGDEQKLEADFLLKPLATQLGTVVVKTGARPMTTVRAQEFAENQKGPGRYITADVFEQEQGRTLTNIIASRIAGITAVKRGGTEEYLASRRNGCFMQIFLNGLQIFRNGMAPFNINTIFSQDVIGIETYTAPATPAKYLGTGAGCGTIVIWTK